MALKLNLVHSAERHYEDGNRLLDAQRVSNAAYHFGLSAECAIKAAMLRAGIAANRHVTVGGESVRAAYYEHLPELRSALLVQAGGRLAAPLLNLVRRDSFMKGWEITIRYSENGAIRQTQASRWRENANAALGLLA